MLSRIPDERISEVFSSALQKEGLINEDDTSIIFYDLSYLLNSPKFKAVMRPKAWH